MYDVYTLNGKNEKCYVTYNEYDSIKNTSCLSITNSKGIKILCTKNKSICKTINEFLIARKGRVKKDTKTKSISNKSKHFTTSKGTVFKAKYNKDGAVLKSNSITLYIVKACDAISPQFGKGTWHQNKQGFYLSFNNGKNIDFPNYSILKSSSCIVDTLNKNNNSLSKECTKDNTISADVFRTTNPYKLKGKCFKGAFKIENVVSENIALGHNLVQNYSPYNFYPTGVSIGKRAVKITAKSKLSSKFTNGAIISGLFKVTGTSMLTLVFGGDITASSILWIKP